MDGTDGLRHALLGGATLALGVVAADLAAYPRVADDVAQAVAYLALLFVGSVVALLAALPGTGQHGPVWARARADGCRWGLLFGALWIVEMLVANLAYGLGGWTTVPYFASIVAVWLLTGYAGFAAVRRGGPWWAGTLVGAWSGLVSGLIALGTMATLPLVAMPVLRRDPQTLAQLRGTRDLAAAICGDFLAGGINHLLIVGLVFGCVLATVGAALGMAARGGGVPAGEGESRGR